MLNVRVSEGLAAIYEVAKKHENPPVARIKLRKRTHTNGFSVSYFANSFLVCAASKRDFKSSRSPLRMLFRRCDVELARSGNDTMLDTIFSLFICVN